MRYGTATQRAGTGVASGCGCDGRMRTARGLRTQESGDGWRTRGVKTLSRSAMVTERFLKRCNSDSTNVTVSDISTRQHC